MAQINGELGEKISSMQAEGGYDTLEIQGQPPPWSDILAVFAAKTAGAADGTTVAILDAHRGAYLQVRHRRTEGSSSFLYSSKLSGLPRSRVRMRAGALSSFARAPGRF